MSVHLRARRTGKTEEGAALFVRAFSRMYARLAGTSSVRQQDKALSLPDCRAHHISSRAEALSPLLDISGFFPDHLKVRCE